MPLSYGGYNLSYISGSSGNWKILNIAVCNQNHKSKYINNYQYNNLDMLINSQGQGIDNPIHTYEVVLEYDKCGSIGLKRFSSENYNCNLIYGYDNKKQSHQPRVISDEENSPLQLFWIIMAIYHR